MPTYRIGEAAAVLGVSVDTARRWADSGRLPTTRSPGGQRVVEGSDLAALAVALAPPRPPEAGRAQSARNRVAGIVTRVVRDEVMAQVELQAGPHRIVALLSREAADELGLDVGVLAVASVKATNVVVEVPT